MRCEIDPHCDIVHVDIIGEDGKHASEKMLFDDFYAIVYETMARIRICRLLERCDKCEGTEEDCDQCQI